MCELNLQGAIHSRVRLHSAPGSEQCSGFERQRLAAVQTDVIHTSPTLVWKPIPHPCLVTFLHALYNMATEQRHHTYGNLM